MTGKQSAVLWIGIFLIIAQFAMGGQFKILFGNIKSGASRAAPSTPSRTAPKGTTNTGPLAGP
jgi:hypothetical protein